jgi:large subunit ribosomal protein L25
MRTQTAPKARRSGLVPGVVYGVGTKNQQVQVDIKSLQKTLKLAGLTSLISFYVGKEEFPVIIRDIQYHPVKGDIIHADFYRVRLDKVLRSVVPLKFKGVSLAVKDMAGVLVRNMTEVEIEALPQHIPHDIEVDIAPLTTFEAVLHIKDLKVPANVKVASGADQVVALVQPPRSEEEIKALAEEVKEDVEAVEGVVKPEKPAEGEAVTEEKAPEKTEKKEAAPK